MPAIDTRVIRQELGEHLNYFVARSVDHRVLETLAVVFTIVFGVGGYMYYAIKVQSK
ncbi:hypothetical protein INS49_007789 [Diaporthe citri]|uniref:uncharacterized protein n=1 Tax=Diaporthe citri TaxID=83186 RepID=UPI001C7EC540|nr:uncharacterized protein INS49_007789 [Diaporthe citri]KAG6362696.1 hypothetical protein INS49_007789 [Diaporthe citri]